MQDDATAGRQSLQTSIEIKLPKSRRQTVDGNKFDFLSKEKKATNNKAQIEALNGRDKSSKRQIPINMLIVIGLLRFGLSPKSRREARFINCTS